MERVLSDYLFEQFSSLVYQKCGIHLQKSLLQTRLNQRLRNTDFSSYEEYYRHLTSAEGGEEFNHFLDCISTNLTSFFREISQFEFLNTVVIPKLMEHKKKTLSNRIRVWCAGCSTGEEAYSVAMNFLYDLEDLKRWDFRVLGTDISKRVLKIAIKGIYSEDKVKQVPDHLRRLYFQRYRNNQGEVFYELNYSLKRVVTFLASNLKDFDSFEGPFEGSFDVIFCRNVMIYFDRETQEALLARIINCLSPGGYLFVGYSESLTGVKHPLTYIRPAVYKKTD